MAFDHPWFAKNLLHYGPRSPLYVPVSWEGNLACLLLVLLIIGIAVRFGRTPMTVVLAVLLAIAFAFLERWAS